MCGRGREAETVLVGQRGRRGEEQHQRRTAPKSPSHRRSFLTINRNLTLAMGPQMKTPDCHSQQSQIAGARNNPNGNRAVALNGWPPLSRPSA